MRGVTELDDKRLARRMLAGDEAAFREFFDSHYPRLYRFALVRTGNDVGAAEEVVQEALCRAVTKLATYRGEASLFTWLCTFCRHEISAHYRRAGVRRERVPLEDVPEIRQALESLGSGPAPDPEDLLERREVARLVQLTLDHLPARYSDALEWKYVHGLSVRQIADRSGISPKAAESVLTRARQAFRHGFVGLLDELAGLSPEPEGSRSGS